MRYLHRGKVRTYKSFTIWKPYGGRIEDLHSAGEGHRHLSRHVKTIYSLGGVKRWEILREIQKYSLPGRPSSQNGVKSKTICHFLRNFDEFLNGFWFYSILAGWSTWLWVFLNFSQNFWSFDTFDTPSCASAVIWNHLKQI